MRKPFIFVIAVALIIAGAVAYLVIRPTAYKARKLREAGDAAAAMKMLDDLAQEGDMDALALLAEYECSDKNVAKAVRLLEGFANSGHAGIQAVWGELILGGHAGNRSAADGRHFLGEAARAGLPRAHYALGVAQLFGIGGASDMSAAARNLARAFDAGQVGAGALLGDLYMAGAAGDDMIAKGRALLTEAERSGLSYASLCLALQYCRDHEYDSARTALKKVARGKAIDAFYTQAIWTEIDRRMAASLEAYMLLMGKGGSKDPAAAYQSAERLLDVSPNTPFAQLVAGIVINEGLADVSQDSEIGTRLIEASAANGCPEAALYLGEAYLPGGTAPPNVAKGLKWYSEAAKHGLREADAILGKMYARGVDTARSPSKAFSHLSKVENWIDFEAWGDLGHLYFTGDGVIKDRDRGLGLLRKSAERGYVFANRTLGEILHAGDGVTKDDTAALAYFARAADAGDATVYEPMGDICYNKKDYLRALSHYEMASGDTVSHARLKAGKIYFLGLAGSRDYKRALECLMASRALADAEALGMLAKILYFGLGTVRNPYAAARYIFESEINDDDLRTIAGDLLYFGKGGVPMDKERGMEYLRLAENHPEALALLGSIYYRGDGVQKEHQKARELFEKASERGNALGAYCLGKMYHDGEGVTRDDERALAYLRLADERGSAEAATLLGIMYRDGDGVGRDQIAADELFARASDRGDIEAKIALCEAYLADGIPNRVIELLADAVASGDGRASFLTAKALIHPKYQPMPDVNKAKPLLQSAVKQGIVGARRLLGILYIENPPTNMELGEKLLTEAANDGDIKACRYLAKAYETGTTMPRNPAKRRECLAILADHGDSEAAAELGRIYLEGDGIAADMGKATEDIRKAAEAGNAEAMFLFGDMLYRGTGMEKNVPEAIGYFEKAFAGGCLKAGIPLGVMHYYGNGVRKDYAAAARYLVPAAEFATPEADAILGRLYFYGQGVTQSNALALTHLEKAIAYNEPIAASVLSQIYYDGRVVLEDYEKARQYAEMVAGSGDPTANRVLGAIYADGLGVGRNHGTAIRHLTIAADAGDVEAQYRLGVLYNTNGALSNRELAFKYLKIAADSGHTEAKKIVSRFVR